jgi:hypothetical protein
LEDKPLNGKAISGETCTEAQNFAVIAGTIGLIRTFLPTTRG